MDYAEMLRRADALMVAISYRRAIIPADSEEWDILGEAYMRVDSTRQLMAAASAKRQGADP